MWSCFSSEIAGLDYFDPGEHPCSLTEPRQRDNHCGTSHGIAAAVALFAALFVMCVAAAGQCESSGGNCCEANGTPGCDDQGCCGLICDGDDFCCLVDWDEFCAGSALELCPGCGGTPPVQAALVGHWDKFSGNYADVWGDGDFAYIAHFGDPAVHIVDISDPANPVGVEYQLPPRFGSASAQDLKTGDGMLFIAPEGSGTASVHVVDVRDPMSPVPLLDIAIPGYKGIHNVFYDNGYLYMADSGTTRVGIIELTNLDPDNPPASPITHTKWIVQNVGNSMVHDVTVVDGRMYVAAWNSGLWIYDVSDVANSLPTFLGSIEGSSTHSMWPTADGEYVVTGEERSGGGIQVYRINDIGKSLELQLTDTLAFSRAVTFSVHNQLIDGYRLYNSWYNAGMWVHDINPDTGQLEFVATYNSGGSVWGVYPFLGPERVLVSDRLSGLYIIRVCDPVAADINLDGVVDVQDLIAVILSWGQPGGAADVNQDGTVDVQDLTQVLLDWGSCG